MNISGHEMFLTLRVKKTEYVCIYTVHIFAQFQFNALKQLVPNKTLKLF